MFGTYDVSPGAQVLGMLSPLFLTISLVLIMVGIGLPYWIIFGSTSYGIFQICSSSVTSCSFSITYLQTSYPDSKYFVYSVHKWLDFVVLRINQPMYPWLENHTFLIFFRSQKLNAFSLKACHYGISWYLWLWSGPFSSSCRNSWYLSTRARRWLTTLNWA